MKIEMTITRIILLGLLFFVFCGCDESKEEREARKFYWPSEDMAARFVGMMTDDEVDIVRAKLNKTEFPAPASTIEKMLPTRLEPFPRIFVDGKDFMYGAASVGSYEAVGGNVMDYWLNKNTVLRVGTVYYYNDNDHFVREVWYELMTPKKAYQEDERGPASQKN